LESGDWNQAIGIDLEEYGSVEHEKWQPISAGPEWLVSAMDIYCGPLSERWDLILDGEVEVEVHSLAERHLPGSWVTAASSPVPSTICWSPTERERKEGVWTRNLELEVPVRAKTGYAIWASELAERREKGTRPACVFWFLKSQPR
jgi:hypothetical protein